MVSNLLYASILIIFSLRGSTFPPKTADVFVRCSQIGLKIFLYLLFCIRVYRHWLIFSLNCGSANSSSIISEKTQGVLYITNVLISNTVWIICLLLILFLLGFIQKTIMLLGRLRKQQNSSNAHIDTHTHKNGTLIYFDNVLHNHARTLNKKIYNISY